MATKTTSVVFKQHEPQSVADLSGVAGALIWGLYGYQMRKMSYFSLLGSQNDVITWSQMAEISVQSKICNLWDKKVSQYFEILSYHQYSSKNPIWIRNFGLVFN